MADTEHADAGESSDPTVSFTVKASDQSKFELTLPLSTTVADLKAKLSEKDLAEIPAERQRLIYSGRVLKDPDTLASTKIKDKHTIHLVKSAVSNARQNPASQGASSSSTSGGTAPAVPQMATGPGNNPLAQLTGARYAGFHGLPGMDAFGVDGGMGAPPNPDDMLRLLEDPNMLQQLNEALENPAVIQMMENNPMMRDNPMARQMLRDPQLRRMMFNPDVIRSQLQLQRAMGGFGDGGAGGFPMPGVTDTTPQPAGGAGSGNNQNQGQQQPQQQQQQQQQARPPNPFAPFATPPGNAAANPFAALFAPQQPPSGTTPSQSQPPAASAGQGATPSPPPDQPGANANQANPFAALFGAAQPGQAGAQDPFSQMAAQMMQNPEAMRAAMQMMGAMYGTGGDANQRAGEGGEAGQGAGAGAGAGLGAGAGAAAQNPFAALLGDAGGGAGMFNPYAGLGGFGGFGGGSPPPVDNRPPEERYAEQLRQLNDMGFFEFERNVQALRRSGGSVQGAVEYLLSGS